MISQNFIEDNFPKGKLTLVCGCPSVGKTAFAVTLAVSMAKRNQKVIYFSLEMGREQLDKRIMLQNRPHLAIEENIAICDTPAIKLSEVRSQLEIQSFDYILIDYLQLIKADNQNLSYEEGLSLTVCSLKEMAEEFDVPIIALSQIDRKGCLRDLQHVDLTAANAAMLSKDSDDPTQMVYKCFKGGKECITHFFFYEYVMDDILDLFYDPGAYQIDGQGSEHFQSESDCLVHEFGQQLVCRSGGDSFYQMFGRLLQVQSILDLRNCGLQKIHNHGFV